MRRGEEAAIFFKEKALRDNREKKIQKLKKKSEQIPRNSESTTSAQVQMK